MGFGILENGELRQANEKTKTNKKTKCILV